jgi:hypothetical protein
MHFRDLGAPACICTDPDYEDLGFAHAPGPVDPGDVVAGMDGSLWRVISVLDLDGESDVVGSLCVVEPVEAESRRLVRPLTTFNRKHGRHGAVRRWTAYSEAAVA